MDDLMNSINDSIDVVVSLDVPDNEVVDRLLKRAEIEGRKDDNEKTIQNRLKVYKEQTAPLLAYYLKQHKLEGINGVGSVDKIFEDIVSCLEKYMN